MSAALQETTTVIDGYIWDTETGECLGPVLRNDFAVTDNDSADWVLSKMLAEHVAIDTVMANARAIADRHQKKLDSLNKRFGQEIEHFAAKQLDGKRERTLNLLYGALSFRKVKGTNKIVDDAAAIAYCKDKAPELVHTAESVNVSEILAKFPDIVKVNVTDDGSTVECEVTWIDATGPGEKFSIKLGSK